MSLPSGYKRLEYIQSSGAQFIETDVPVKSTSGFVVNFASVDTSVVSGLIGGFNYGGYNNNFGQYNSQWVAQYGNNQSHFFGAVDTARHTVSQNVEAGLVFFDGTQILPGVTFYDNTQRTFRLFCYNGGDSYPTFWIGSFKLYSCQIYDNGTLVRDFIPCQKPDGTIGLWDDVNSVFYGNAGTGTFTTEPVIAIEASESEITEIEYIQSSGTQYIDTGVPVKSTSGFEVSFAMTATSGQIGVIGGFTYGGYNHNFAAYYGKWFTQYGNNEGYQFGSVDTERHTVSQNVKSGTVYFDGETIKTGLTYYDNTSRTFRLFCYNGGDSYPTFWIGALKLYSCKIYDNGTLVRDYIPAKLYDGTVGLYDKLNGLLYVNAGTGTFEAGPSSLNLPVNIGGTWKDANEAFVNIGGTWKAVKDAFVNIGGAWKKIG